MTVIDAGGLVRRQRRNTGLGSGFFVFPAHAPNPFPAGRLTNAVITRKVPVRLGAEGSGLWPTESDSLALAVTDRGGHWIARGIAQNTAPDLMVLATTYTTSVYIVVLGNSSKAMAMAHSSCTMASASARPAVTVVNIATISMACDPWSDAAWM